MNGRPDARRQSEFRQATPNRPNERLVALLSHQDGSEAQVDVTTLTPAEFAARASKWDSMGTSYRLKRMDGDRPSFLGGAMSIYAEPCGNNARCNGEDIRPMTEAEAREWLESRGLVEELEQLFGNSIEDA
jgi:hypothetical protein